MIAGKLLELANIFNCMILCINNCACGMVFQSLSHNILNLAYPFTCTLCVHVGNADCIQSCLLDDVPKIC